MSDEEMEIVRGSANPFADAGVSDADTELMKADLATEIVRILRERNLTGERAAELADVARADLSRIRNAALDRFTIDRLVKILNRLDSHVQVGVIVRPRGRAGHQPGAARP